MKNKWAGWYAGVDEPQAYGETTTYELAAEFLSDCATVEDWGTGKGWFKTLRSDAIGVDGTDSPFADVVADLRFYRTDADGILLRHVLEHNYDWADILSNAASSARRKLCIVLFTPCGPETREIAFTEEVGVPDMSFNVSDITDRLGAFTVDVSMLSTNTQYGQETMLQATR